MAILADQLTQISKFYLERTPILNISIGGQAKQPDTKCQLCIAHQVRYPQNRTKTQQWETPYWCFNNLMCSTM